MDFKKLFRKNDKAVSPVIGVILMVAITVILAAAIGSSVFGQGTTKAAPKANFDIKAGAITDTDTVASVKLEHLGGDAVHFEDVQITKVTASLNGASSVEINADGAGTPDDADTDHGLGTMGVGDVSELELTAVDSSKQFSVASGDTVNIKVIDVQTNQLICDKDVRF